MSILVVVVSVQCLRFSPPLLFLNLLLLRAVDFSQVQV